MNVLKKKYMYVQAFSCDSTVNKGSLVGFHHGCDDGLNQELIHDMTGRGLFPHYGFSFYENPPGRIIRHGRGGRPTLFRSDRLYTLGLSSFVKVIAAQDMFNDDGLAFHRNLSFLMVIGKRDALFDDFRLYLDFKSRDDNDHPLVRFFSQRPEDHGTGIKPCLEILGGQHDLLEIVGDLDYDSDNGYADSVYLMSGLSSSLVLSHITIRNLIEKESHGLAELLQIPVLDERYSGLLESVFQFDRKSAFRGGIGTEKLSLCGISPGILGYGDVVLDVAKRTVSGKRTDLVRFILHLNREGVLDQMDLRYLV